MDGLRHLTGPAFIWFVHIAVFGDTRRYAVDGQAECDALTTVALDQKSEKMNGSDKWAAEWKGVQGE